MAPSASEVTVLVEEGLGNRLWQIASAYGLAKRRHGTFRLYEECIRASPHNANQRRAYDRFYAPFLATEPFDITDWTTVDTQYDSSCRTDKLVEHPAQRLRLRGFFQHYLNFHEYRDEICRYFGPTDDDKQRLQHLYPDINRAYFVHVRLGDFVGNVVSFVDLTEYYRDCLAEIRGRDPDAPIYIVTCSTTAELTKHYPCLAAYPTVDVDDVMAMHFIAACGKGGVSSNSTLSWWGCYLGHTSRTVYMPSIQHQMPTCWPLTPTGHLYPGLRIVSIQKLYELYQVHIVIGVIVLLLLIAIISRARSRALTR